jgi:hypothetical protein
MEKNCEKIGKLWKKLQLNSGMIGKNMEEKKGE